MQHCVDMTVCVGLLLQGIINQVANSVNVWNDCIYESDVYKNNFETLHTSKLLRKCTPGHVLYKIGKYGMLANKTTIHFVQIMLSSNDLYSYSSNHLGQDSY